MTNERLQQLLKSPPLLSAIPYEELKTLALTYPYAANLQLLLLLKSAQEQHPEEQRNLATAAAYSLDRKHLFHLLNERAVAPIATLEEPEVLELKPLSALPVREEAIPAKEQASEALATTAPPTQEETYPSDDSKERLRETWSAEAARSGTQEPPSSELSTEKEPFTAPATSQQRFTSFVEWVNHFNLVLLSKAVASAPVGTSLRAEPTGAEKTTGIAQQLAQKSISENPEIASETLARLYAQQGYRDKAAEMYRRLMVLYPEKSAFFASQIEALTKNT